MIETGNRYKSKAIVTEAMTAKAVGSGDLPVLASPAMIALMENAAMLAVAAHLKENETTVGGFMECSHLKPTAVGEEIEALAILRKIDGAALHFDIEASAGEKKIGTGHHVRYVVDRERFMAKLK
ncbi:MAG: thioesterase family protein [Bacteroidales bacterium]|nr:thioesterase family protein [Bacteroidales bacterium]